MMLQAPCSNSEPLDPGAVEALRALSDPGEQDVFQEFAEAFLADFLDRGQRLSRAVRDHDAAALKATAHTLKGSSSNLGALRLAGVCEALEDFSRNPEWPAIWALLEDLQREFELLKSAIHKEIKG